MFDKIAQPNGVRRLKCSIPYRRAIPILRQIILFYLLSQSSIENTHASRFEFIDIGRGPVSIALPDSTDPEVGNPLVLLLHGYGIGPFLLEPYVRFLPLVDEYGFVYARPSGTSDASNTLFWNATDACCDFFSSGVDDSTYLLDLINAIKSQYAVDENQVYIVGVSNGGFMAHRMACDHSEVVAAIASVAGGTFQDSMDCTPSGPVHILQIHGTADDVVDYNGGVVDIVEGVDPLAPYPGALETVEQWATYNGCSLVPDTSQAPLDLESSIPGNETLVTQYTSACSPDGSAELWTIQGGGHFLTTTDDFRRLVIEFFFSHPKVTTPSPSAVGNWEVYE